MNMPVYSGNKGTLITLEAEEKILTIDETTKNGMVLSSTELSRCQKQGHQDGNLCNGR